jgi:glycosyltransferase involved in cell wall biosynthesis
VIFHEPVSPDEVILFANNFDIGLAMEESVPFNRDICLTNKIFTYMQAGLAVLASDTTAQAELIAGYPDAGEIYKKGDLNSFAKAITRYMDNPDDLYNAKKSSFRIGHEELNWENESAKFIQLVNQTLAG